MVSGQHINFLNLDISETKQKFNLRPRALNFQFNSDNSRMLVTMSKSSKILVLDVTNEVLLFEFISYGGVAFSPDGASIYGSSQYGDLLCFDAETGSPLPCSFLLPETSDGCYETVFVMCPGSMVLM
jgi:WD40 repeat protein